MDNRGSADQSALIAKANSFALHYGTVLSFPRLQMASCMQPSIDFLRSCLQPQLKRLDMIFHSTWKDTSSHIQLVSVHSSYLTRLTYLCMDLCPPEAIWSMASSLQCLTRLEMFISDSEVILSRAMWSTLGSLPGLRGLIGQLMGRYERPLHAATFSGNFSVLERLQLAMNYTDALVLFSSQVPSSLHMVNVHLVASNGPTEASTVINAITQSVHDLSTFEFTSNTLHPMGVEVLENIQSFHRLTRLIIQTNGVIDCSDRDVEELAKSLPLLQYLNLGSRPTGWHPGYGPTRLTLNAVNAIAQHCPVIKVLRIYVTTAAPNPPTNYPLISFTTLGMLDFGVSLVIDTRSLATRIAALCPNPRTRIEWAEIDNTRWRQVGSLLETKRQYYRAQ